jgi:hypothetical protein
LTLRVFLMAAASGLILMLGAASPSALALVLLGASVALVSRLMFLRTTAGAYLWDRSMLQCVAPRQWFASLWLWWLVLTAILVGIYVRFW